MPNPDTLKRENEALRNCISKLSAASLRISASLNLATVLREAVECACELTGARYGVIATIDESGKIQEVVTAGFTPEEEGRLLDWPNGVRLFEHFRDLSGPVRLRDLPDYVQSLGFSSKLVLSKTFLGTPMYHQGVNFGNFFLSGKEGSREFTSEDEQVLVLFASQAAAAIANARTHRAEQQARADLEALVETSPVGVVVLGAGTGHPLRFNLEARRIVEGPRPSGQSPEQLLKAITCRRADGREIALNEFLLAQESSAATTVRAEEMVLEVPDGRSVRTLINATLIRSADGEVELLVVTMQDLAPLEELERSQAEFLSLVSHELRAPLTSIKGSTATVLGASPPLVPGEMRQFFHIIDQQADHMRGLVSDLLDAGRIETGTLSVAPEPAEVANLVELARNTFQSGGGKHTHSCRPASEPAPGAGRPEAHRPGSEQPLLQRLQARSHILSDPGGCDAAWRLRGHFDLRRRQGRAAGPATLPVSEEHAGRRRRSGAWDQGVGTGPGHLQGAGGGPRRPNPGRERREGSGHADYFHHPGGRADRTQRRTRIGPRRPPARYGKGMTPGAFWWWTTIPRRSATFGTLSRKRAIPPW